MKHKEARARIREQAAEEARQDAEQEARLERRLRRWKRGKMSLGIALAASCGAVIPFLCRYPLHDRWDAIGKRILLLTMGLFLAFMYAAGTTYTFWSYLRAIKKIHRRFASLAADTEWANKAGGRWQALSHSAPTSPTYIG